MWSSLYFDRGVKKSGQIAKKLPSSVLNSPALFSLKVELDSKNSHTLTLLTQVNPFISGIPLK